MDARKMTKPERVGMSPLFVCVNLSAPGEFLASLNEEDQTLQVRAARASHLAEDLVIAVQWFGVGGLQASSKTRLPHKSYPAELRINLVLQ